MKDSNSTGGEPSTVPVLPTSQRQFSSPHQTTPRTQLLSNGHYAVMMTAAGSGYSNWGDVAITRWREDTTCDCWGSYIFLRDVESGAVWSAGYQPTGIEPDRYEAGFFEDRVEIDRADGSISTKLQVVISPDDDAEGRRVSITNHGNRPREIELTSYAELVLSSAAADVAHPAYAKMFVETHAADVDIGHHGAILATRRRGSPDDPAVWVAQLAVVEGELVGDAESETDRAQFLGRGPDVRNPASVMDGRPLSNTFGAVLDPVFSLRRRVKLQAGATAHVAFWTVFAKSRSEVLDLVGKYYDPGAFERTLGQASTRSRAELSSLHVTSDEANVFQQLASHVLYSSNALRPSSDVLSHSVGGQSDLWALSISGDLPIVVCRIDDVKDLQIVQQLARAQQYWRAKQLLVDLVIINEQPSAHAQDAKDLQAALEAATRSTQSASPAAEKVAQGKVYILRGEQLSPATRSLLLSAARAVLFSHHGSLAEQVTLPDEPTSTSARLPQPRARNEPTDDPKNKSPKEGSEPAAPHRDLAFFNGIGGFANDGREYVTILADGESTPAPWINVIANPTFGFQVSAEGGGYTWAQNSQQNQLTPWSNDPVSDRPGEVLYVRDEDDGTVWSPTALPIRERTAPYVVTHGQGYTRFEHSSHGISLELVQYVPVEDPIKISRLKIRNQSGRPRHLSVTAYVEWVLGVLRTASAPFIVTEIDPETRAMLARGHWQPDSAAYVAFADLSGQQTSWTGDRTEFLGRNGALASPAALGQSIPLTNSVGGGFDPCSALQTRIDLAPDGEAEVVFFLGESVTRADAVALIKRYRTVDLDAVLREVTQRWDDLLSTVQITTPDRATDVLLNRWLQYQVLSCRVWARTAFYQASGAYGYRDQLQDVMALSVSAPDITRAHLLRAAARQFVQGDVQHWWLPPSGKGIRTRISDDLLWLPYVIAQYVETTGDTAVMDETVPFLDGPVLAPDKLESYFQPSISNQLGTLFEHGARALDASLRVGSHGLPLMGTGDWDDGMNRIGVGGKGESIWLAWFLHSALSAFVPLAERRGEHERAARWRQHATDLASALERDGWDGGWYKRAYFDDGTPVGVHDSDECQITSIAQSWGVLSGAANRDRVTTAMAAVDDQLVRRDDAMVLLFTPPFDRTTRDPGYIKGYPPGMRENGGQYTHGALWSVIAFAMLGDGDKAGELFSLLNPIKHGGTPAGIDRYKVEPYVMSADVYSEPSHVGRGGWTWYTGSAGWMYRAGLEWLLGFRLRGSSLVIDPCIPKSWPGFTIVFRYHSARYEIKVENPNAVSRGVSRVMLDGKALPADAAVALFDDAKTHHLDVVLGS
ncbi:MAG: hypothetical protein ABI026_07980 [Gemmatimonadaceae bacterium]